MTRIQRRQLSKIGPSFLPILILINLVSLFFSFKNTFIFNLLLYILFAILLFIIYKINKKRINLLKIKEQDILEKNNLLKESIRKQELLADAFDKKNSRYVSLREALDKFNQTLKLEELGRIITEETFKLFGIEANVILFLINQESHKLEIIFAKKRSPELIIKEKNGDLFDEWVLRHNQCLLVEDAESDFRFEPERIKNEISRLVGSVIICPMATTNKFLGILRLDSPQPGKFSIEDLRFLSMVSDLAAVSLENSSLYEHTEELAIKDGLTGLYLRRYLEECAQLQISLCYKQGFESSVLIIDIDHFKRFNDKLGHHAGDIILLNISDLLKGIFHCDNHIVSRFGGEEFVVLLLKTKKQEALNLAESLRKSIEAGVIFMRRSPIKITVSIGVSGYPQDANNWTDLIKQADQAMYQAKERGRNRVCGACL